VVEKDGEMPDGVAVKPPDLRLSAAALLDQDSRPASRASSFRTYELADNGVRPSTPDAIKVIRPKKKGSAAKGRRTTKIDELQ